MIYICDLDALDQLDRDLYDILEALAPYIRAYPRATYRRGFLETYYVGESFVIALAARSSLSRVMVPSSHHPTPYHDNAFDRGRFTGAAGDHGR